MLIELVELHHTAVGVMQKGLVLNLKFHGENHYSGFVNLLLGKVAGSVGHQYIIHNIVLR